MSFTVNFYNLSKKINSTKRPAGAAVSYECNLKAESSINNPEIILNRGTSSAPLYNYAYIPEYGKYYFVNNWEWYENRLWKASLTIDTLATYKDDIGAKSLYVLRSSADFDGSIMDKHYFTKTYSERRFTGLTYPWPTTMGRCTVSVGVVSKSANYGSLKYYVFQPSEFRQMISALLDDNLLTESGFSSDDASIQLQKAIVDPLSFIRSIVFLPVAYEDIGGTETTVSIWDWDLDGVTAKTLGANAPWLNFNQSVTIPRHPQAESRGNYLNCEPFTNSFLEFIPFGTLQLDTTITANYPDIDIMYSIDLITGNGILKVMSGPYNLGTLSGMVGVPLQLSQVTKDYLKAGGDLLGGAAGIVGGSILGDFGSIAKGVSSMIEGGVTAKRPHVSNIGSQGTFLNIHYTPGVYTQFFYIADEQKSRIGRPLCKVKKISDIPGYIMVESGEIDIKASPKEMNEIKGYLEGGFFYE